MVRSSAAYLLTVAAAALVSGVSAGLAEARAALAKRQTSGRPNHVQNWANDYADVDFQLGDNGSFTVTWDDGFAGNFVVGRGYQPARDMLVNYTGTWQLSNGGWAYLALYGWTMNPLVEYYVIESMGAHNPSDNVSATQYGCHQSDGGTYELWQKKRTNAPSIIGDNTDFEQYWSVRRTMRQSGTINTGNHFRAWEAAGLHLGNQLYMDMGIEGQRGQGSATVTVGIGPTTSVRETPTPTYRSEKRAGTCPTTSTSTSTTTRRTSTTTRRTSTTTTPRTTTTTRRSTTTTPRSTTTTPRSTTTTAAPTTTTVASPTTTPTATTDTVITRTISFS